MLMRLGHIAIAVLLAGGVAVAQDQDAKSKMKVKVDEGKTLTVTGCVERGDEGSLLLTNVAGKEGSLGSYVLAKGDDDHAFDDLHKHVGHRVEIEGKAADKGKGKISVEAKTEGTSGKTESKSEVKGDLKGLPYLGVKSVKMLASVCP
jgi:hypothetical protein